MKPLHILFLFVLIDVLGFSLVLPLFPYLRKQFDMSYQMLGWLQSSNAIAQLIFVPIIGSLSDRYGRKPLLIVCVIGTMVSFILFATANSVWMLFFSRILDGLLGGNISLAQAYISDLTQKEERTRGFGLVGAAFGLAFIVGPACGGILATFNYSYPPWAAAALSLLNLFAIIKWLPESHHQRPSDSGPNQPFIPAIDTIKEIFNSSSTRYFLSMRFIHSLIFTIFEVWFGYFTFDFLHLSTMHSSYLLTFYGSLYSIVQATGMRNRILKLGEQSLLLWGFASLALFYSATYLVVRTTLDFAALLIPLAISSGVCNTLISASVSKHTDPEHQGGMLGISAALGSLSRIIGPTTTSLLVQDLSLSSPPIVNAFLAVLLIGLLLALKQATPNSEISKQLKEQKQD